MRDGQLPQWTAHHLIYRTHQFRPRSTPGGDDMYLSLIDKLICVFLCVSSCQVTLCHEQDTDTPVLFSPPIHRGQMRTTSCNPMPTTRWWGCPQRSSPRSCPAVRQRWVPHWPVATHLYGCTELKLAAWKKNIWNICVKGTKRERTWIICEVKVWLFFLQECMLNGWLRWLSGLQRFLRALVFSFL